MQLVHWLLMGGLLHLVQRGGDWAGRSLSRPLLAVPNVTNTPINGQCTNHRIAVTIRCSLVLMCPLKGNSQRSFRLVSKCRGNPSVSRLIQFLQTVFIVNVQIDVESFDRGLLTCNFSKPSDNKEAFASFCLSLGSDES